MIPAANAEVEKVDLRSKTKQNTYLEQLNNFQKTPKEPPHPTRKEFSRGIPPN